MSIRFKTSGLKPAAAKTDGKTVGFCVNVDFSGMMSEFCTVEICAY